MKLFLGLQILTTLAAVSLEAAAGKNSGEFLLLGRRASHGDGETAITAWAGCE